MKSLKHCKLLTLSVFCALLPCGLAGSSARADSFTVTYLAPGVQTPAGVTSQYETFSDPSDVRASSIVTNFNGSGITGTYTGSFNILPAGQYGGAGGAGDYLSISYNHTATLTLSQSVNYFGLWVSALDAGNLLRFYENNTLVYSFTPADMIAALGPCVNSNPYCGNPTTQQDSNQQFAFINFYDLAGSFNKVTFYEGPGGAFESDNNAVAEVQSTTGTVVGGTTPEPSSMVLLGTGFAGLGGMIRKRMRK